jgi:hypothetical protein
MAAASQAVEVYEKRKAAAAAAVKAGSLSAQVAVQALAKQKARAVALGPSQAKEASNRVSGEACRRTAQRTCVQLGMVLSTCSYTVTDSSNSIPASCCTVGVHNCVLETGM